MDLSKTDIQEIYEFIDLTRGMSINGVDINCFAEIYNHMLSNTKEKISTFKIINYKDQINLLKDSFETFGGEDSSFFDRILEYLDELLSK